MWGRSEKSFRSSSAIVRTTTCVAEASQSDIWIFCVPAQALRPCLAHIQSLQVSSTPHMALLTCKGVERSSGMLMTEIFREFFPETPVAMIAGPNFASELSQGAFSGLTIGTETRDHFFLAAALFRQPRLHLQHVLSSNALSAWGALKNVSALACGILWGMTKSHNTLCTFITQAFMQSKTWVEAHLGASSQEASLSYGGLGDFVMSCTSQSSRNFRYGIFLATQSHEGGSEATQELVEGIESLYGILARSACSGIALPFAISLEQIISRSSRAEHWLHTLCNFSPTDC